MRDIDVRTAVRQMLTDQYGNDPQTRIVEEMGIWSGSVRVDLAVINGELHGFELKSARDTLERLPTQAELYNQVFDRVTLVTAERHICAATKKIKKWWGVILAYPDGNGGIALREVTPARPNPHVDPIQLMRLLWRSELLGLLKRYGIDHGVRSGTVEAMASRLIDGLPLPQLAAEVRSVLKIRIGWLGKAVSHVRQVAVNTDANPRGATPRGGPGCLNSVSSLISGTSAGFRPPRCAVAG